MLSVDTRLEPWGMLSRKFKSFLSKLQMLIKREGPRMDGLIQRHGKEKIQKSLEPLRILYHKEKVRPMADEMSLVLGQNTETTWWDSTTYISGNKEKLRDKSEKVASHKEAKEEDFGDYPTDLYRHENINLWVEKKVNQAVNQA